MQIRDLFYLLFCFAGLLIIPVFFQKTSFLLRQMSSKSKTVSRIGYLGVLLSVPSLMALLAPGIQWSDSPYILLTLCLLGVLWTTEKKNSQTKTRYWNQIAISGIELSFIYGIIVLWLIFYKETSGVWLLQRWPFAGSLFVPLMLSILLGGGLGLYESQKQEVKSTLTKILGYL
ncbi:MAG TPA: hypothetical protein PKY88_13030 [Anaerohalosphaeraceae bacterium]|nr:hypothetical protein [Anaerohalosphaeraceae bacterium]